MTTATGACKDGRVCGGTGFVHIDGTHSARECDCRIRRHPGLCFEKAGIPDDYLDASFSNFKPLGKVPSHAEAIADLQSFVDNWPEHRRVGDCVALLGPTRLGKSHLAIATMREIIIRHQVSVEEDFALFLNWSNWVDEWNTFWSRWPVSMPDKRKYDDVEWNRLSAQLHRKASMMKQVQLLVLDDLGQEKPNPSMLNKLYNIVEWRVSRNLPIIVTANMSWNAVVRKYGDESRRIVDRLRERSVDHTFIIEQVARKKATRRKGGK